MKLKGLTKLALSGVALAAVAATLGTSTYAWYVTNSTAKVTGINGKVNAGGAGNILVAQATTTDATDYQNGHGQFLPAIEMDAANITANVNGLIPALPVKSDYVKDTDLKLTNETTTTAAYYSIGTSNAKVETLLNDNTKWVDAKGEVISTDNAFIKFDLWVINTEDDTAKLEYKITNTTSAETVLYDQLAYSSTGLPTGVSKGSIFNSNIINALRIGYTQTNYISSTEANYTEVSGATLTAGPQDGVTYYTKSGDTYSVATLTLVPDDPDNNIEEHYEFTSGVTYYTKADGETEYRDVTASDSGYSVAPTASTILDAAANAKLIGAHTGGHVFTSDGNANDYYNSVMGLKDPIVRSATNITDSNKYKTITLNKNEETKLTFYIWLEGSDEQCFDSVQGQQFELEFTFSK